MVGVVCVYCICVCVLRCVVLYGMGTQDLYFGISKIGCSAAYRPVSKYYILHGNTLYSDDLWWFSGVYLSCYLIFLEKNTCKYGGRAIIHIFDFTISISLILQVNIVTCVNPFQHCFIAVRPFYVISFSTNIHSLSFNGNTWYICLPSHQISP